MNFLMTAIMLFWVGCTILDALIGGNVAFATTKLTVDLPADGVTTYVETTRNFPLSMNLTDEGIFIGTEYIGYDNKTSGANPSFIGLQRSKQYGTANTTGVIHLIGCLVMSEESNHLNTLMGYNVVTSEGIFGKATAIVDTVLNWAWSFPQFLMWDYNFLEDVSIIKPFLWCISIGVVVVFALYIKKLTSLFG